MSPGGGSVRGRGSNGRGSQTSKNVWLVWLSLCTSCHTNTLNRYCLEIKRLFRDNRDCLETIQTILRQKRLFRDNRLLKDSTNRREIEETV